MLIALSLYLMFGETLSTLQRPIQNVIFMEGINLPSQEFPLPWAIGPGAPMTKIHCLLWFLMKVIALHHILCPFGGTIPATE